MFTKGLQYVNLFVILVLDFLSIENNIRVIFSVALANFRVKNLKKKKKLCKTLYFRNNLKLHNFISYNEKNTRVMNIFNFLFLLLYNVT